MIRERVGENDQREREREEENDQREIVMDEARKGGSVMVYIQQIFGGKHIHTNFGVGN